jgi:acetyltransferase-like isoleucine patch superfamily enzyme
MTGSKSFSIHRTTEKTTAIDENVLLGYPPSRKLRASELSLGDGARVRSGSVIYAGSRIGAGLETGHNVVIREENNIGINFSIWSNSVIDYGCKIGDNVKVHCNCYVAQLTRIEDDVFLAPGVAIANDKYMELPRFSEALKGATIEHHCRIGTNAVILPGVTIGERSIIGAASVVTKNIPSMSVAFGNPARVYRTNKES